MRPLAIVAALCAAALTQVAPAGHGAQRASTLTRLVPPPDGQAHFGFTFRLWDTKDPQYGDSRSFDERIHDSIRTELAAKTPTFIKVWAPWQRPDDARQPLVPFAAALADVRTVENVVGEHGILQLDWNIASTTARNGGITTLDVASGSLDRYIRAYARDVKAYGRPVLITLFNGEFNGDWWYGVSPRANGSLTTGDFVRAWRRVVDIFRAVGARNASWAWVVNGYPKTPVTNIDSNIGAYYPGDDYVDWAGVDVYDVGTTEWLDGPYAFAVEHGKPLFVAEFGIRHEWSILTPPQQRTWLAAMFDYFESHPGIKAISYFNYNNRPGGTRVAWDPARAVYLDGGRVSYLPDVNDHDHRLLAGGPEVQALFARRISSSRYVASIATENVDATAQAATVTLLSPTVRGRTAVLRWRGNLSLDTVDVALRRSGAWRTVATRVATGRYVLHGRARERVGMRVRARDVYGATGPWGSARTVTFSRGA